MLTKGEYKEIFKLSLSPLEYYIMSVLIGVAPGNLTGELLSWKEIIGSGAEIGERYAHGTNWHLAVSEQSFGLNLILRKVCHSYHIQIKTEE